MKSQSLEYDEPTAAKPVDLSIIPPRGEVTRTGSADLQYVVADGYSFSRDRELTANLRMCAKHQVPFAVDSFKACTRNIEKLLIIIEYLLQNGTEFVTSNYMIANGYLERRINLLKPGSDYIEMRRNWQQTAGLCPYHKKVLEAMTAG